MERDTFIGSNFDSPFDLLTPQLARLAALGGFGRLGPAIGRFLTDERLRRLFSFQSLYAGLAAGQALAAYAVIAYMDTVAGVWFPKGGVGAVAEAMAEAATDAGADVRLSTSAAWLERTGRPGHRRPHHARRADPVRRGRAHPRPAGQLPAARHGATPPAAAALVAVGGRAARRA